MILNEDQLREEIVFLRRSLRSKQRLASVRAGRGLEPSALKTKAPYEHRSAKVVLLMEWARAVCDFYNLTVGLPDVLFRSPNSHQLKGLLCLKLSHCASASAIPEGKAAGGGFSPGDRI